MLWLKELGIAKGNVPKVENYTWLQSHCTCVVVERIRNSRRECAKGEELYMVATNESRKSRRFFSSLPQKFH